MARRRFWLSMGGMVLLAAVGALCWSATQPSGIGRLGWLRIRTGMSPAQVEAVIGCPPGDYRADPPTICETWSHTPGHTRQDWYSDDGHLRVVFDADHRVAGAEWQPHEEFTVDRLLHWLAPYANSLSGSKIALLSIGY